MYIYHALINALSAHYYYLLVYQEALYHLAWKRPSSQACFLFCFDHCYFKFCVHLKTISVVSGKGGYHGTFLFTARSQKQISQFHSDLRYSLAGKQ